MHPPLPVDLFVKFLVKSLKYKSIKKGNDLIWTSYLLVRQRMAIVNATMNRERDMALCALVFKVKSSQAQAKA